MISRLCRRKRGWKGKRGSRPTTLAPETFADASNRKSGKKGRARILRMCTVQRVEGQFRQPRENRNQTSIQSNAGTVNPSNRRGEGEVREEDYSLYEKTIELGNHQLFHEKRGRRGLCKPPLSLDYQTAGVLFSRSRLNTTPKEGQLFAISRFIGISMTKTRVRESHSALLKRKRGGERARQPIQSDAVVKAES